MDGAFICTPANARKDSSLRFITDYMEIRARYTGEEPKYMPLHELQVITNCFSKEFGRGGFGVVYKVKCEDNKEVAPKMLLVRPHGNRNKEFKEELLKLVKLSHQNKIQLVGNTQTKYNQQIDKLEPCTRTALCFAYAPDGNLHEYTFDGDHRLDWHTLYNIIKGTCEGLHYLHHHPSGFMWHLDMKPENVLLHDNMVPKITDFSLSKLFDDPTSKVMQVGGTMDYMLTEHKTRGKLTSKFDISSLGVIVIEMIAGINTYRELVLEKWKGISRECREQVKTCTEMALDCVDIDRKKRPEISHIINKLKKVGNIVPPIPLSRNSRKYQGSSTREFGNGGSFLLPSNETTKHPPGFRDQEREIAALGRVLIGASVEPVMLSYTVCRYITKDFSQVIGEGGFGVVYLGVVRKRNIAVKKLSKIDAFSEHQFQEELKCLSRVKHKNIVRFLGYCSDTQQQLLRFNGENVIADLRQRLLCFEYVPNKSLHEYLNDESYIRGWNTRYQLIKGICEGMHYLHKEERIVHLDLKPDNILLDANMVPKITDFGLSIRFSGEQSRMVTETAFGSLGYMAPEYQFKGLVSFKADIFSLGIIMIKLLRGHNDLPEIKDWHESLHTDCPQMKTCIGIAQMCVDKEPNKRPDMDYIIDKLNEKENM